MKAAPDPRVSAEERAPKPLVPSPPGLEQALLQAQRAAAHSGPWQEGVQAAKPGQQP